MVKRFDNLTLGAKIFFLIPIRGWIFTGIYRIIAFTEDQKNYEALWVGALCFIPFIGIIVAILDICTQAEYGQMSIGFSWTIIQKTNQEENKSNESSTDSTTTKK